MPKTKHALFFLHLLFSLAACLPQARLLAADADNDGLDDDWELSMGLDPARTTRLIYLDAVSGDDMNCLHIIRGEYWRDQRKYRIFVRNFRITNQSQLLQLPLLCTKCR